LSYKIASGKAVFGPTVKL